MDIDRAEEIVRSLGYINVTYEDKPVWIESINQGMGMVVVKDMDSNKTEEVPISSLVETDPK